MEAIKKDLDRRKKIIVEDKQALAEATGSEKELLKQLTAEFSLSDLGEAEAELERIKQQKLEKGTEIQEDYANLTENFQW